jgi:hypothetical protein
MNFRVPVMQAPYELHFSASGITFSIYEWRRSRRATLHVHQSIRRMRPEQIITVLQECGRVAFDSEICRASALFYSTKKDGEQREVLFPE